MIALKSLTHRLIINNEIKENRFDDDYDKHVTMTFTGDVVDCHSVHNTVRWFYFRVRLTDYNIY